MPTTLAKTPRILAPAARRTASDKPANKAPADTADDAVLRDHMIATAAYFRAERRGFAAGSELQDWLEGEAEVEGMLRDAAKPDC